jgi:hypothetical protein
VNGRGDEAGEQVNGVTGRERREQVDQAEEVWCGGKDDAEVTTQGNNMGKTQCDPTR